MKRLPLSLAIGAATAVILTAMRGGMTDMPVVVPIFGLVGFVAAYSVSWLLDLDRRCSTAGHFWARPRVVLAREVVAVGIAISTGFWSGGPIEYGGYAAWLVALALGFVVPLVVGIVSARLPVVCGLLAVTSIAVEIAVRHHRWRVKAFGERAGESWADEAMLLAVGWSILAALALSTCVPVAVRRSRAKRWNWPAREDGPGWYNNTNRNHARPSL